MKLIRPCKIISVILQNTGSAAAGIIFLILAGASVIPENKDQDNSNNGEVVYFFTDRDLYIAGEEVFFKMYKFNCREALFGNGSKISYVDMSDNSGNPVVQLKLGTEGISGSGAFRIPDTLKTGIYYVRSYTSMMRNYPTDRFTFKKIAVINPFREITTMNNGNLSDKQNKDKLSVENIKLIRRDTSFRDAGSEITFDIRMEPAIYSSREKVSLEITARDKEGSPVETGFHIAVAKSFTRLDYRCINCMESTCISTETTGHSVFNVASSGDNRVNETDITEILPISSEKSYGLQEFFPVEITGHFITGTIRDRSTGDPLGYEKLSLSFIGKTARCRFTTTDENGFFAFISGEYGTHEIVIQPLSQPAAGYYVELNDPFAAHEDFHMPFLLQVDTAMIDDINKAIISAQVKALYDPYLQPVKQKNASGSSNHFYGEPDKKIDLSKFIELTSLREVIKEIVPGVSTITRNDRSNFKLINKFPNQPFENPPLVLLDGVPVYDLDNLLEIRSSELEYIEVLNTRYFMADNIFDGIINIISCKGDLSILEFNRSVFRQEFKGLHTGHFPWSPDYSIDSLKKSRIPDFRNTLYWNPEMKTDKNGKANVGFFTSDESGEYTIAVEGFSHDGRSGRSEIRFIVR